jgi:hypothetical protein
MTEFSYDIVEDEYGKKLAIEFEYDEDIKNRLKGLPWDTTHRAWNPDVSAWTIELTPASIQAFEEEFDESVPDEYRPDEGTGGDDEDTGTEAGSGANDFQTAAEQSPESATTSESTGSDYDEDAAIEDALVDTRDISSSGHGLTTYPAVQRIDDVPVYVYNVLITTGEQAQSAAERRRRAYTAMREIREEYEDRAPPMAYAGDLEVVALHPIPGDGSLESEGVRELKEAGERTLELSNQAERAQIQRLVEEAFKRRVADQDFIVHGMHKILKGNPIPIQAGTGNFRLHERFDCAITVASSGRVYLHVNPKTRVQTDYTLDKVENHRLYPGLRLVATYNGRGYRLGRVQSERARNPTIDAETSVVDYHRDDNPLVDDKTVEQIDSANRRVVTAYPMGSGGKQTFPQELLALQGHTSNLADFDGDFWSEAQPKMRRSASTRVEDAVEFAQQVGDVPFDGTTLSFPADAPLFAGDSHFRVEQLYETDAEVLKFANGRLGSHPKEVSQKGIYEPPASFNILYVYPQQLEGDRADSFWDTFSRKLRSMGAEPDSRSDITFEPTPKRDGPGDVDIQVGRQVPSGHDYDAALVVLPPEEGALTSFYQPYDELKEVLAEKGLHSQMIDRKSMNETGYHQNIALGLISAAGGIPFTVEGSLPGDTDLYLAFDVGQYFDDDDDGLQDGIRVGASVTAITNEGAVLGYAHTGPQAGERIPASALRRIARQSLLGYEERRGDAPDHIVIHRDGFMNDPIEPALKFLDERGISYDVVEVRKQAPARIVNQEGGFANPDKAIACINDEQHLAYIATYGQPEPLAKGTTGTPRPITVERKHGDTNIETLTRQVYLLAQCHIGVANTTTRLPITTAYADRAATAAAKGHLPMTSDLETGIGFL